MLLTFVSLQSHMTDYYVTIFTEYDIYYGDIYAYNTKVKLEFNDRLE